MREFLPVFILVAAALSSGMVHAEEHRIGAVLGLTGAAHVWADNARSAIELAADEINKGAGPQGDTVRVIFEDSRSTPAGGVTAFEKLTKQDKVSVIIGDVWAYLTIPLMTLSSREKVILISPTVMDRSVPEPGPYFFSLGHRFESVDAPLRRFFDLHPDIRRPATLSFDDVWNEAFITSFADIAKERGVSVAKTIRLNDFTPAFKTEIAQIRQAGADALFATWRPEVALQRMKELDFNVPLLTSSDAVEAVLFRASDRELLNGTHFIDWESSEEFKQKFRSRFARDPLYEAQNSYEAVRSIAKAFAGGESDLRAALSRVVYEGVEGKIDFRGTHFPNRAQASLFAVKDGQFIPR